jgi:Flagellar assembly protein FliH
VRAAEFVSLAELLAPAAEPPAAPAAPPVADAPAAGATPEEIVAAIRDARLFGARLHDALRDARDALLAALAADVVARELRTAPCDLDALLRRCAAIVPAVRVRVAPDDVPHVRSLPVVADDTLQPGDAIVELAGGALDARLGVRLAAVLEALQ